MGLAKSSTNLVMTIPLIFYHFTTMTFTSTIKPPKESFYESLPSNTENSVLLFMYFGDKIEIITFTIKTCNKFNEMHRDNLPKNIRFNAVCSSVCCC